jgi:predicted permease
VTPLPQPPLTARLLLRLRRLGEHRADVEADLLELFRVRAATSPQLARRRYYADVMSVWLRGPRSTPPVRSRRLSRLSMIPQDVVFSARLLRKRPLPIAVTILGLALGVGVSTAGFTFLNVVALRPYGMSDPDSVVLVRRVDALGISTFWPVEAFEAIGPLSSIQLEGWSGRYGVAVRQDGAASTTGNVTFVSGSFFTTLGARLAAGRPLLPSDNVPGAPPVVVLNHGYWVRRFDGDPAVVGRTVFLNNQPALIVGVIEPGFTGPTERLPGFWTPLAARLVLFPKEPMLLTVAGRLAAGAGPPQAAAEIASRVAGLTSTSAAVTAGDLRGVRIDPAARNRWSSRLWSAVIVIAVIVALVLFVACANATNLMLASALERRREIAVRLALGASRGRLVRQLLTESVMVGLAGAGLGFLVSMWVVPTVAAMVELDPTINLAPDGRVYLFVALIAIVAGVGAGLAPARQGTTGDLVSPLQGDGVPSGGTLRGRRLRAVLIGAQAAASMLLVVLAALAARGLMHASSVDLGYDPDRLLLATPRFPPHYDGARIRAYWRAADERLRGVTGIEATGLTENPPFTSGRMSAQFDRGGQRHTVNFVMISADYFSTLGMSLLRGRGFTTEEIATDAPVAVISDNLARAFWPDENPIGDSLARVTDAAANLRVVGVVPATVTARLREPDAATVYRPLRELRPAYMLVRVSGSADDFTAVAQTALQAIDPELRLSVLTVRSRVDDQLDDARTFATLAGALGIVALCLSCVGIFGVTAFIVGHRTREISVRLAIGATAAHVLQLLLRDSLRPVVIGLTIGLALALAGSRVVASVLHGIGARDPLSFAGATMLLILAAATAVIVPASRALRIDPAPLLKQ